MAASVEFAPELYKGERYGHSLAGLRAMGHVAVEGSGFESTPIVAHNFDDFVTAITENIATDNEFGESLVVGTPKTRRIVEGKVVDLNGRPIVDVVSTGAESSRALAEKDPSYIPQRIRDEGDVLFAEAVDSLIVGEVVHVVSMDPKEQMLVDPKRWEAVGYRKGMAVQHVAYRLDNSTTLTWTYIIKQSDKKAIAEIYRNYFGVDIPADTHSDTWIRNMHRSRSTLEEVEKIGLRTLQKHKEITGSTIKHYSATDFAAIQVDTLKNYFDTYMIPLSRATASHRNDPVLQELARTISQTVQKMKPEIMRGLIRVANRNYFDDEDARLMQSMIRYAAVEDLRKKLPDFMKETDKGMVQNGIEIQPHTVMATYLYNPEVSHLAQRSVEVMNTIMALNINEGVAAKRNPGGCSGIALSEDESGLPGLRNNIFGKIDASDTQPKVIEGKDGKGPLKFTCAKGHENTREDGKPLVKKCQERGCSEAVSCGPEEEKLKDSKSKNVVSLFPKHLNYESRTRKKVAA